MNGIILSAIPSLVSHSLRINSHIPRNHCVFIKESNTEYKQTQYKEGLIKQKQNWIARLDVIYKPAYKTYSKQLNAVTSR